MCLNLVKLGACILLTDCRDRDHTSFQPLEWCCQSGVWCHLKAWAPGLCVILVLRSTICTFRISGTSLCSRIVTEVLKSVKLMTNATYCTRIQRQYDLLTVSWNFVKWPLCSKHLYTLINTGLFTCLGKARLWELPLYPIAV